MSERNENATVTDDLREDILGILEKRVRQAIQVIKELRNQNDALETRVEQLESEIERLNEMIRDLRERNAELLHFEEEIQRLQEERRLETTRVEEERQQIRTRLEGILDLLNRAEMAGTSNDAALE